MWAKDKKPLIAWIEDHRLRSELKFNTHDLDEMDEEERIFHLSLFYAQDVYSEKLQNKREKEAKDMKARMRGMRRRVRK